MLRLILLKREQITDTREPWASEAATMDDSESQTVLPLEPRSTSATRPIRADFPMREGYWPAASSRTRTRRPSSSSPDSKFEAANARGDEYRSELCGVFDDFLGFDGMSGFYGVQRRD